MTENEDPSRAAFSTPVRDSSSLTFSARRSFSAATTQRRLTSVEKENHNRLHLRKPSSLSASSPASLGGGEGATTVPHTAPPGSSKLLRKLLRTSDRRRLLQTGPVRLSPAVSKAATTTPKRVKQQLASIAPALEDDEEPRIGIEGSNKTPSSRELLKSTNSSRNHRIRSLRLFDHNNNGQSLAPSPLMDKNVVMESTDPAADIARSSSSRKSHAFVVPPLRTGTTVPTTIHPTYPTTTDNRDDVIMDDDLEVLTSGGSLHPVSARQDCTNPMSRTLWNQQEERGTPTTTASPTSSCESPACVRAMSPPPAIVRPMPTRMLPPRASS